MATGADGATDGAAAAETDRPFAREEWRGTRLALAGKALILVVMGVYVVATFNAPSIYWPLGFVLGFAVTGIIQFVVASRRPHWTVARVMLIVVDAAALAVVISVPNPLSGFDLPPQMPFRGSYFALLIVYIASVGYTYKPLIALSAGLGSAAAWAGLAALVHWRPETVDWTALAGPITREDIFALYGEPYFFDNTARQLEVIAIVLTALLIAGLVWRSRRQVTQLLRAEADRQAARAEQRFIRETFGRYVPDAVAQAILEDRGRLEPSKRMATVLFVDVVGFTALGERVEPDRLLRILNAYFDAAGRVITDHGGTINQFQGDAILASFNVPVADPAHAASAVGTAQALVSLVARERFEGERLTIRVGLHTGELAAGAVGSSERLSYTVHGACVNLAARLEQLNKALGTAVLLTEDTARAAGYPDFLRDAGAHRLRGVAEPVPLYTVEDGAEADLAARRQRSEQ